MTERTAEQYFELSEVQKAYTESFFKVTGLLGKIKQQVYDHETAHPSPDWGDVGDLNAIAEALREIAEVK